MQLAWSDFYTVLIIARCGSVAKACIVLSITHATLLRQIDAIEKRLKTRLFDRQRGKYTLTSAGEEVVNAAKVFEPIANDSELRIAGQDLRPSGDIRVAVASIVIEHLLPPLLSQFASAFPEVKIELAASREHMSLARREADVAIRITDAVPDWLVGRQLADLDFKIYTIKRQGFHPALRTVKELALQARWIGFDRDARDLKFDRWLEHQVPDAHVKLRVDNFSHALTMVRAGLGIALLPTFLEKTCLDLQPLTAPIAELKTPLWIVTHQELRNTKRIKVLMQAFGTALKRDL